MEQLSYWQRQDKKSLFPAVDVERPEQKQLAGKMLIIGGNKTAFYAVSSMAEKANKIGIGEISIVLPDSLKAKIPRINDMIFMPSEVSGGFSKEAIRVTILATENADYVLVAGDLGKNAETATFLTEVIKTQEKPTLLTRDAIDLVATNSADWLSRENMNLCATLPQLQKIFKAVYYPKMLTLSMPTNQLVETLHKFTITYPVLIVTLHNEQIVVAKNGEVVTTAMKDTEYTPISIWSGDLASKIAAYQIWNRGMDFEAAVSAVLA